MSLENTTSQERFFSALEAARAEKNRDRLVLKAT
jgi:hypothetical protein